MGIPDLERRQHDLVGALAGAADDRREEARAAHLPQLEGAVDGRVTRQHVALRVERQARDVALVSLQDLPLHGRAHVINRNGSLVRPNRQPLRLVVEVHHREHLHQHVQDH